MLKRELLTNPEIRYGYELARADLDEAAASMARLVDVVAQLKAERDRLLEALRCAEQVIISALPREKNEDT